jgi:hypothetical protein
VSAEELTSVVDHGRLLIREADQFFLVAEVVNQFVWHACCAGKTGVGVPDELAVQLTDGKYHSQFSYRRLQSDFIASEIGSEVLASGGQFRTVYHDGHWSNIWHTAP